MNQSYKLTIGDYIEMFLKDQIKGVAVLKEIYQFVKTYLPNTAEETIRCAIYRDTKNRFKRIAKGMYMLVGENTSSLLIKGDSRGLKEIEDESIDCIITDHPWEDKKAHRSGNQKEFAKYCKFKYEQEDFNNKARVLKDGCFLAEFIPMESESNYEYLYELKKMAKNAGLNYYAKIMWQKDEARNRCLGRTTKEFEEIMIFYKGKKPRKLSEGRISGYRTREVLPTINPYYKSKDGIERLHDLCESLIDVVEEEKDIIMNELIATRQVLPIINRYYAAKGKNKKNHDSEKPIELYEFLIEMLTDEKEVLLDQFGGACNLLKAAINKNRFGIVYEIFDEFVQKAVDRFKCIPLTEEDNISVEDSQEEQEYDNLIIDTILEKNVIPHEVTQFQLNFLNTIKEKRNSLLSREDFSIINNGNEDSSYLSLEINELFNKIVKLGYSDYKVPEFNIGLEDYVYLNQMELELNNIFDNKFNNNYLKNYYMNYKIESRAFVEFCLSQERIFDFDYIKANLNTLLYKYISYIRENYKQINYSKSFKILNEFLY